MLLKIKFKTNHEKTFLFAYRACPRHSQSKGRENSTLAQQIPVGYRVRKRSIFAEILRIIAQKSEIETKGSCKNCATNSLFYFFWKQIFQWAFAQFWVKEKKLETTTENLFASLKNESTFYVDFPLAFGGFFSKFWTNGFGGRYPKAAASVCVGHD